MRRLGIVVCWAVVSVFVQAVSIGHAAEGTCGAYVSDDGTLHIPEVNVDGAVYWATLQPEPSTDGAIVLKVTDYGPVAESRCQNSEQTFFVESEGAHRAFIPTVNYAGADYWALLELVPSADGLLWLKVTGYGNGGDWSGEGGALLATMKVEVVQASELSTTVRGRSPLGIEAEITTTLLPNQPASSPSLTYSQPTEGTHQFRLTYTVPYSDLPPEVAGRLRAASALNPTRDAEQDTGVSVVIEAVLKERDEWVLEYIAKGAFGKTAGAVVNAGGGVLDLIEALDIREKHKELMKQLDALEECVKKVYSNDPASLQSKLNYLEEFRFAAKAGTGMRFMMVMNEVIYGATPLVVPLAGLGAAGSTRLDELDKSLLEQAALFTVGGTTKDGKFFPNSCPVYWSGTFEGSYTLSMDNCTVQEIKVTAEVQFDSFNYAPYGDVSSIYHMKSGSLHVTATDPWSTCHLAGDTWDWYLSPSSVTVSLPPTTAITLYVTPLHGDEWFAIHYVLVVDPDPGELGLPAMQTKLHAYNPDGGDYWTTFDREEWNVANGIAAAMIAAGESVDFRVISYRGGFQFGAAKTTGRWYLKQE